MKVPSCCSDDEANLTLLGSTEQRQRYQRLLVAIHEFYEFEYGGRWGTDYEKEADLLAALHLICLEMSGLI